MRMEWILAGWFFVGVVAKLPGEEAKKVESPETRATVETSGSTAASGPQRVAGRKALEDLLDSPAKLDFGGRTEVSAREILDQLRELHELSIRFDVPTFVWFFGTESIISMVESGKVDTPSIPSNSSEQTPAGGPSATEPQNPATATVAEADSPVTNTSVGRQGTDSKVERELGGGLSRLMQARVDLGTMNLRKNSIRTILNQLLGSIPIPVEEMGLPIPATNAMMLDYLVEEDGILITTRMQALTTKETRVYSLKRLIDFPPDQLAKLIRKSIRPYSWRAQFDDFGDKLKGVELPTEAVTSLLQAGAAMAELENVTISTTEGGGEPVTPPAVPENHAEGSKENGKALERAGNGLANILVALTHAGLLTVEMLHYGDPPTGTIEVLPGKIVVTQSQSAHREIAELLEALEKE